MSIEYQLKGDWDFAKTYLFMKAMFCRQAQYNFVSEEGLNFVKEWASYGAPFAKTDFVRIFDDFHLEFHSNPSKFYKDFFKEFETSNWPEENLKTLLMTIYDYVHIPLNCGSQIVFLKIIRHITRINYGDIENYESIDRLQGSAPDFNFYILNELYDLDAVFDIINEEKNNNSLENYSRQARENELLILIDSSISETINSININYTKFETFQGLLDFLYQFLSIKSIEKYSYGRQWVLSKKLGSEYREIQKRNHPDNSTLPESGIGKNDILKLSKK